MEGTDWIFLNCDQQSKTPPAPAIGFKLDQIAYATFAKDDAQSIAAPILQPQWLSSLGEGMKIIFETACYRQTPTDKLLNRADDIPRIAARKLYAFPAQNLYPVW